MKKRIVVCLILIFSLLLASCQSGGSGAYLCKVMLPDGEGYEVYGEQIITIERGSRAEFEVGILPNYEFLSVSAGEYSDGKLIIQNVRTGTTVKFNCVPISDITRTATNGNITVTPLDKSGMFVVGSSAEVHVEPLENYYIDTVTVNGNEINGDKNVDGSLNFMVILTKELEINASCLGDLYNFSFTIYGDGNASVNIDGDAAHYGDTVVFEFTPPPENSGNKLSLVKLNGKRINTENDVLEVLVQDSFYVEAYFVGANSVPVYYYENFTADESPFEHEAYSYKSYVNLINFYSEMNTRVGYVCAGFNTEPDGSGEGYNFGALLYLTSDIHLYAQWEEETSPSYLLTEESADKVTVKGLSGSGNSSSLTKLVIPNSINGKPVTAIAAEAFKDNESITLLVLGNNITSIGEHAFQNCTALERVIFSDSASSLPENAFADCPSLSTFELNSIYDAVENGVNSTLAYRFAQLKNKDRAPRYILISGSSGHYGIDSTYFNKNMDKEVLVIGANANMGLSPLLSIVTNLAMENDTIITSPEIGTLMYSNSSTTFSNTNLSYIYKNSDVLKYIDFRYCNPLKSIISKLNDKIFVVSQITSLINDYGVLTTYRPNNVDSYNSYSLQIHKNLLTPLFFNYISFFTNKLKDKGAVLYFSFPPANKNGLVNDATNYLYRLEFEEILRNELSKINVPLISELENYLFAGRYFYNSNYHPSTEGALLRTIQLVKDIKAQQAKEGKS